jgi:hypothetical protein
MSCTNKIGHSMTARPMPMGLIAREAKRWIGEGPCKPAENSRSTGYSDNIDQNGLADTEHRDPKHVWGDEGPVND